MATRPAQLSHDTVAPPGSIDALHASMTVVEDPAYSRDYLDLEMRSVANTVQVFFRDGTATQKVAVENSIGHWRRHAEALPLLVRKFAANAAMRLAACRYETHLAL